MAEHIESCHVDMGGVECTQCSRMFKTRKILRNHRKICSQMLPVADATQLAVETVPLTITGDADTEMIITTGVPETEMMTITGDADAAQPLDGWATVE